MKSLVVNAEIGSFDGAEFKAGQSIEWDGESDLVFPRAESGFYLTHLRLSVTFADGFKMGEIIRLKFDVALPASEYATIIRSGTLSVGHDCS